VILRHGGRLALSDDSHGPDAVALNYRRLRDYLRDEGVEQIWHLQLSDESNAGGRAVCSVVVEGDWTEHKFWASS
jgi:histidinol-phosphatase (PHP family)